MKDVADQAAIDLHDFASQMSADVQVFKASNREMFAQMSRAVQVLHEFDMPVARIQGDRNALEQLMRSVTSSQSGITEFQSIVSVLPPLTAKIRKARKRASIVLGELIAELQFSLHEGAKVLEAMDALGVRVPTAVS